MCQILIIKMSLKERVLVVVTQVLPVRHNGVYC